MHPWSLTMTMVYWAQKGSKQTKFSGKGRERGVWRLWRGAQQISSLRLGWGGCGKEQRMFGNQKAEKQPVRCSQSGEGGHRDLSLALSWAQA